MCHQGKNTARSAGGAKGFVARRVEEKLALPREILEDIQAKERPIVCHRGGRPVNQKEVD